jgi:hypothetical protein
MTFLIGSARGALALFGLLLLAACGGGGGGGGDAAPSSMPPSQGSSSGDAFTDTVAGFAATQIDTSEPTAIDVVALTQTDDKEPAPVM